MLASRLRLRPRLPPPSPRRRWSSRLLAHGSGLHGQLGSGGGFEDAEGWRAVDLGTDEPLRAVAGWGHSAVLTKRGDLLLFGRPYDVRAVMRMNHWQFVLPGLARLASWAGAQWGDESGVYDSPVQVDFGDRPEAGAVVDLSASAGLTLACCSGGGLFALGDNSYAQCGPATTEGTAFEPVMVEGVSDVVQVSSGLHHVLCRSAAGVVWAWGRGERGQLGDGQKEGGSKPHVVPGLEARAVAAGHNHAAAVTVNGEAVVWGKSMSLDLQEETSVAGQPLQDDQLSPRLLDLPAAKEAVGVACSSHQVAVLTGDGEVFVAGMAEDTRAAVARPLPVEGMDRLHDTEGGVALLRRGFRRVLALTARGGVHTVVLEATRAYLEPASPPPPEGMGRPVDVSTGWQHSLMVMSQ